MPGPRPDPRAGNDGDAGDGSVPRRRINARITEVVDGDTVKVRASGAKHKDYTVRLIGIDTPETKRPGVPVECGGRGGKLEHVPPRVPNGARQRQ